MNIKTERLFLRTFRMNDLELLIKYHNDPEVTRYSGENYPYTRTDGITFIDYCKEYPENNPGVFYPFAIEFENKLAGYIGLFGVSRIYKRADVGFWLGRDYWGKGIMSEAIDSLINLAFSDLNINLLEANTAKDNIPSNKLLKSKGFLLDDKKQGKFNSKLDGKCYDLAFYYLANKK